MDEVSSSDPEWDYVNRFLYLHGGQRNICSFQTTRMWRVREISLFRGYKAANARLGKPTRLFHGTSLSSAWRIAKSGFKLPKHSGLYGPGIYFADDVRKSANYAPESSWRPFFRRITNLTHSIVSSLFTRDEGQVLLCDVYLGACRTLRFSSSTKKPAEDLKGGWLRRATGLGDYTSLCACGLFSDTEYIVFKEHQAIPKVLIEFEYVRAGSKAS